MKLAQPLRGSFCKFPFHLITYFHRHTHLSLCLRACEHLHQLEPELCNYLYCFLIGGEAIEYPSTCAKGTHARSHIAKSKIKKTGKGLNEVGNVEDEEEEEEEEKEGEAPLQG